MHKACPLSELAPGEALRLNTAPPIAVFHTEDGELFAIDDTCTHQDASLSDGEIIGDEIECPLHGGAFNIRTGEPASFPVVVAIEKYRVRVVGDDVQVAITR